MHHKEQKSDPHIEVKIKHVLEEARVLLPGTQVLLGFQFSAVFQQQFTKLPHDLKYLHLVALCTLSIAIIMLFSVVSYHRIVEKGQDTDSLHSFSHTMILSALIFVGLGLCIDMFIVTSIITQNTLIARVLTLAFGLFSFFLWFGYTWFKRKMKREASA